jgi:hypothetical protein
MWQIKYQNDFLDIVPGQSLEIERRSALFLLDDIIAEYSTPFALAYSDKNSRLIGHYFFDTTVKTKKSIDVEVYDNGTYRTNATMVIESAGMNFLHPGAGTASGYLLLGISNFFAQVKDKKLTELSLGGNRNFPFTTTDPTDASGGYWQHFNEIYDFTDDYVMLPCKNLAFTDEDIEFTDSSEWMNRWDGTAIATDQPVVPWPKLEYVLTQIFEEHGWTLDTTGIDDTLWKKILLFSNFTVSTNLYGWDGAAIVKTPFNEVNFTLANCMPKDVTISGFLLAACKRYFWTPVCDIVNHTCYLIALRTVPALTPKDWTKYAGMSQQSDFTVEEKIFSFKNNFTGEDKLPASVDLTQYPNGVGFVYSYDLLPDLVAGNYDDDVFYTFLENKYWIVEWDSSGHTKTWVELGDNIYDAEEDDATDTFETDVTTLPIASVQFEGGFFGNVPVCEQEKKSEWGIRTVIYHGLTKQVDIDGSPISATYPYGSSINIPPGGTPLVAWSNVYEHSSFDKEYGIIEYWAKRWLQAIAPHRRNYAALFPAAA